MARAEPKIPNNSVKLLFAEDLVSYVMLSYDSSFEFVKTSEWLRNHVHNAFNDTVRQAIDFLTSQFREGNSLKFEILQAARMKDRSVFLKIAESLREGFFTKGFEARKFLYYCAHVSSMAGIFYTSGTKEAPYIAADAIVASLSGYPTESGAWDTVNAIAEVMSKMADSCEQDKYPVESFVRDHYNNKSPVCYSPRISEDENSEEEPLFDYEKNMLNYLSLDEFVGIDKEWKNVLLPLLAMQDFSSSDESNE